MNKRLVSHFRPQGEGVQMNEWSVSSLSNHLCNVTSPVCAHLCQQQRLVQNVWQWRLLPTTLSYTASFSLCPPRPLSLFLHYPFYAVAPYVTDRTEWAPLVLLTLNKTYQLNQLQWTRWRICFLIVIASIFRLDFFCSSPQTVTCRHCWRQVETIPHSKQFIIPPIKYVILTFEHIFGRYTLLLEIKILGDKINK